MQALQEGGGPGNLVVVTSGLRPEKRRLELANFAHAEAAAIGLYLVLVYGEDIPKQ